MSWRYDGSRGVWTCTSYSDLQYADINNFAEYGQPWSPYERSFLHNHVPDFGNIVIEMPQTEVMTAGYGRNLTPTNFPLVESFLRTGDADTDGALTGAWENLTRALGASSDALPPGRHLLGNLIDRGIVPNGSRFIRSNLYGWGSYGVTSGSIAAGDAAYIHGTISFALMRSTVFVVDPRFRRVEAEMGAGDDNWDFNSSTISGPVNAAVATILGPAHYNLTAPIRMLYRGRGRRASVQRNL
ncbi:MAG: hypothetical protein RIK87_03310 [Fuerstiella sp.]